MVVSQGIAMVKPSGLVGCGEVFSKTEHGITFNHGNKEGIVLVWTNWGPKEVNGRPWRCGEPYSKGGNETTYYCEKCQILVGLKW